MTAHSGIPTINDAARGPGHRRASGDQRADPAPGDADHFAFQAEAGQTLALEVNARRLGSPLDSILTLYNSTGRKLAEHDDPAPQAVPNALGTGVENDSARRSIPATRC